MKKKLLFKFFVFAVIGSLLTVTSCKDYEDDINSLDSEISNAKSTLSTMQTQLTALQTALTTAQSDATAAKTAATDAKTAADEAKAAAAEAKAAALTAKAEAIEAAADELAALKATLEAAIAKKLDITVFDNAMLLLDARINGIEEGLGTLTDQMTAAEEAITDLISADVALQIQLDALKEYAEATQSFAENNAADIAKAQADIEAAQQEISDLWEQIAADKEELLGLIGENATNIATLFTDLEATNQSIEDLKEYVEEELTTIKNDISFIKGKISEIDDEIIAINDKLSTLRRIITNRLTAITLATNVYVDGIEAIYFSSLKYKPMDASENALVPATDYRFSTAAPAIASYKFNPRTFDLANAEYSYVDRTATIINTRAAASSLVKIEGDPDYNSTDGTVNFILRRQNAHSTQPTGNKGNFIQLEAALKGNAIDANESGVIIAAAQELVYDKILDASNVRIADKATLIIDGNDAHYPVTFDAAKEDDPWYEMAYDQIFDLKLRVATCANDGGHGVFNVEDYNLKYKFYVASTAYPITTNQTTTDQQKWIELVDEDAGTFKAEGFNREAIGRTPILKVELVDAAGNVVRRAFVKVQIVANKTPDMTIGGSPYDLVFKCNSTTATYEIDEEYIRENLYRVIDNGKTAPGLSHEMFWNTYEYFNAGVTKNGYLANNITAPVIVDGNTGTGTATKKIVWEFTHGEIGSVGVSGAALVGSVTVKNKLSSSDFPEYVTFQFTVNVTMPEFSLTKTENDPLWLQSENGDYTAYKVNVKTPNNILSPADQCIFNTSLPQAYKVYSVTNSSLACTESEYRVTKTFANGSATTSVLTGVQINGDYITLNKENNAVKAALNSIGGLQAEISHVFTLENGDEWIVNQFIVNFIRPVNLNMPDGVTVKDAQTGGDVADFQWDGILTDWRNEAIVSPEWNRVQKSYSYWKNIFVQQYDLVQGHYNLVTPATLDVVIDSVSFVVTTPVDVFNGKAKYKIERRRNKNQQWSNVHTFTIETDEPKISENDVIAYLGSESIKYYNNYNKSKDYEYKLIQDGDPTFTKEVINIGQTLKYTYIKSINYVPAVYEWIEGGYVANPGSVNTPMPTYKGTTNGEVSGDGNWVWTTRTWNGWNWESGQYWYYYGKFGKVTIDISGLTTSLPDGKLPSEENIDLIQNGNTILYKNNGSPIGYAYEIYIPVSIKYGWGTVTSTLTITVNPVN